jgi:malate dehydrogenase (oxaloacetate-decarboxylating)(NADP+)
LRAAVQFKQDGYGVPVLVGRDARVTEKLIGLGANPDEYEIHNSAQSPLVEKMVDRLYSRLQRRGYLRRDIQRMVNRDRNIFGALLLQMSMSSKH